MAKAHIKLNFFVNQHSHASRMRKRQRTLKPGRPSRANELWYKSELLRIVKLLRSTTVSDLTPFLKRETQDFQGDAAPRSLAQELQTTAKKFGNIGETAKRISRLAVQRNLESTDKQLVSHIKQSVGINIQPALTNDGVREALAKATQANVELITSIPAEYFSKVEAILQKNWEVGTRWEELIDLVNHVSDVTESRAKLIARDQTSKMNGAFNMERQTSIGIDSYEWQTAGDERVRESHADNDGKVFAWDSPPEETGNPGDDINCRCVAIPHFDLDAMEEEVGISGEDSISLGDFNPNHDEKGRFSDVDSANGKLEKLGKPNARDERLWRENNVMGKEIPKSEILVSSPMKFDPAYQTGEKLLPNLDSHPERGTREVIPISKIIATQPAIGKSLTSSKISGIVKGVRYGVPEVHKTADGKYALIDGHHTVSAMKLLGIKKVPVNVHYHTEAQLLKQLE